jgi:hypothetical protein
MLSIYMTEGGVFNDCLTRFRQANGNCNTVNRYIGTATFTVTGCNSATFSFDITFPGATSASNIRRTGTQNLVGFGTDTIAGRNVCTGAVVAGASTALPPTNIMSDAFQGAWYEPRTSGQGFIWDYLQTANGGVSFSGWYSYWPGQVNTQFGNARTWMTVQSAPGQEDIGDIYMSDSPRSQFNAPPILEPSDFRVLRQIQTQPINCQQMRVTAPNGVAFNPSAPTPFAAPGSNSVVLTRLSPVPYFEYMDGNNYVKVPYCQ